MPYVDQDEAEERAIARLWEMLWGMLHAMRKIAAGDPDPAGIAARALEKFGPAGTGLAAQNRPEVMP